MSKDGMTGVMLGVGMVGLTASVAASGVPGGRHMEKLDRGVVAVPAVGGGILVNWRLLGDEDGARFIVLRDGKQVARTAAGDPTSFLDRKGLADSRYVVQRVGGAGSTEARVWDKGYLSIPLDLPAGGTMPDGQAFTYEMNEGTLGDVDGDGRYELIVKWDPSNRRDNAMAGYTGSTLIDAYTLDGRKLWRIDLGRNIRSGSHYTQFIVQDYDGDGRAELAMKTADGTRDGAGRVIGDVNADWVTRDGEVASEDSTGATIRADGSKAAKLVGRVLRGPEYLTVFDGLTGRALATAPYDPPRAPGGNPTMDEQKTIWGDGYGNRSDRFLGGAAYLDGKLPSMIFGRGYYARSVIAAWDWRGGKLTKRWVFDSAQPGQADYGGQGNHQLSIADVDGDGRDEIVYGSMAVDDDGKGLWTAKLYHGDALHVGDLDPTHPGLERFGPHESPAKNGGIGTTMIAARTGRVLWSTPAEKDVGRGVAADIDPRYVGAEAWGANNNNLYDVRGRVVGVKPRPSSFVIWWDGDRLREILDGNKIEKWDWQAGKSRRLLAPTDVDKSNGTKATPVLQADMIGDWREEVVWRSIDSRELRIYATPYPTKHRYVSLMLDPVYRAGIAWQNVAYNQPPHTSFYLGEPAATDKPK